MEKYFTSESVNMGHPDKTCDIIADAFLDEALRQDPNSQMAVECAIKNNKLFVYGEATTAAKIDYDKIARDVLQDIGYDAKSFVITKEISKQSPDINRAVVKPILAANDQGMVFGYATNETQEYLPLPILLAHKIMKKYDEFRRKNKNYFADAKAQVTIKYVDQQPVEIDTILISVSHTEKLEHKTIEDDIKKEVLFPILEQYKIYTKNPKIIVNPSGKFTIWGSFGDSGCVGRKIVVDTYGGACPVGGGCFSSKNATKVDRSGAYYARYVAKNIVAHGLSDRCEIQVSYAIGMTQPISMYIETFGTEKVPVAQIYDYVKSNFDFSPQNIIDELELLKPIYKPTACFGHFGRAEFAWEKIK